MLFAYGTLQDPDILVAVLGRRVLADAIKSARAPGFGVVYYPGRVYPALVTMPSHDASGMIISDLTALDMARLDAFEGDEYRRATIAVQVAGILVQAEVYLPVIDIPTDCPMWSLQHWTGVHKPKVFAEEARSAQKLHERLSAD